MKKYLFLLLILGSLTAMGQEEDLPLVVQNEGMREERPRLIQYLDMTDVNSLSILLWGNYSTYYVIQDTVDYVAVQLASWDDTSLVPSNICTLNKKQMPHYAYLHAGGIGSYGFMEIHTTIKDLGIANQHYNTVTVSSTSDTLRLTELTVQACDFSTVAFRGPIVVEERVYMEAEHKALIKYHSYECEDFGESTRDQGSIIGYYRNGENIRPFKFNTVGEMFHSYNKRYTLTDRIHLNLYGAYNDCPVRIDKEYESAYSNRPSEFKGGIGSYQIELAYDIVARKHFTFGMGVGFNMDKYKFKDPYVRYISLMPIIDPEYGPIGVSGYYSVYVDDPPVCGGDSLQYWKSGLNVPFISFPVHVAYYANKDHKKGLHVGLDFIPRASIKGYAYQRYGQPTGESTFNGKPYEEFINMYGRDFIDPVVQIDIRLSVGWGAWSIFGQYSSGMASLLMFDYEYAYKVGLKLTL